MIFEVDEHDEVATILYEHTPAHGPVLVQATSNMLRLLCRHINPLLLQPRNILLANILNLMILSIEIAQYLDDAPLHLQLCLLGHQRRKGCCLEVA